ncbi:MAG: prolyl oligopeptidase family serine peptidase, partial [Phycisphaerales bacterium]|nr:prolyl oligopeptidase family serine peptidase [Phycisphaerales bacterium]
ERHADQDQGVLHVRSDGQPPRILIDPNTLDADGLVSLDWWKPSPDGSVVAFGLSRAGDEMSTLHLLDTDSGRWRPLEIPGKCRLSGWTPDGSAFLYSRLLDPADPYSRAVLWHEMGQHPRHDRLITRQEEPSRIPFGTLSRNGRWIFLGLSDGWSRNDLKVLNVAQWKADPDTPLATISEGREGRFEPWFVIDDTAYIYTTLDAPNGRMMAMDLRTPTMENWETIVPQRDDAVLQSASRAMGMVILTWEKDATTSFQRIRPDGSMIGPITLPGLGSARISTDPDHRKAYLSYASYNEPRTIYRVNLVTDQRTLWARPKVPVNPDNIVVAREWATSPDGTRVPMFVIHHRDVTPGDGPHPTLIYGYGGFNISLTPGFYATNFPWYDAGGVYVVANLRGGGEYGEDWHRDGMLESKQNVFDDLYACAEHLISEGWTDPEHLAVMGGSNGGLLTGVAATQRPELWSGVVSAVPLLDMLRYHKFLMARFWVPEYGSAENPEQFAWLRAYSPYHHIEKNRKYPAMLILAGENDSRVHPLHARKMAARMQWATTDDPTAEPVLLLVERDAGHGQGKPKSMRVQNLADRWAFIMWQTGLCKGSTP